MQAPKGLTFNLNALQRPLGCVCSPSLIISTMPSEISPLPPSMLFPHFGVIPNSFLISCIQIPNLGDHALLMSLKPVHSFHPCCNCLNSSPYDPFPGKAVGYRKKNHSSDLVSEGRVLDSHPLLISGLTLEQFLDVS